MKRGQKWFERIIQCCILLTGLYIIYRGTGILAETGWAERIWKPEKAAEAMEEMTANMYLPGYITVLEQIPEDTPVYQWLELFLPALRQWVRQALEASSDTGEQEQTEESTDKVSEAEEAEETGESESGKDEVGEKESKKEETQESGSGKDEAVEKESEKGEAEEKVTEEENTGKEAAGEVRTGEDAPSKEEPGKEGTDGETEATFEDSDGKCGEEETGESKAQEVLGLPVGGLDSFEYLLNHYFVVDSDTRIDEELLDAEKLLSKNFYLEKNREVPQILIYHTHSQEFFLDSREEDIDTGILGVGDYLTEILEEQYGYQVIHDRGIYDLVDGILDRSSAYDYARASVEKILEEYPTIEVIIDLHRDGVEGEHFVTEINGKPTARIMFFNGLSRNSAGQSIDYLYNPYIEENLGFSLRLQLAAEKNYPGFTRNIYLKGQRFNLHLRPRSLLIEAGTQLNTVEEEKNAMEPLADILDQVLQEKESK